MSHVVVFCKRHIDAYNRVLWEQAHHTHTADHTGVHKEKQNENTRQQEKLWS